MCLFQITHNQQNVLDLSWMEEGAELAHEELEPLSHNMASSLRQLIDQRDKASEVLSGLIIHYPFNNVMNVTHRKVIKVN